MTAFFPVILFFLVVFKDLFLHQLVAAPLDTLVGAYYPWLDYKWGTVTGVAVKNPIISDVFSYFFFLKHIGIETLLSGTLPFWNRFLFSGTPLMATYHLNLFHPFNFVFLLPRYYGWNLYIVLSHFFAALGFYLYTKKFTSSPWPRLMGALVYAFSGLMSTWSEFATAVWAMAALPYILLSIDRVLDHQPKYLFLLSFATLCLTLSGHVQILTYSCLLIPCYILSRARSIKIFFILNITFVAGILLASFQLLPTYMFFKDSIRGLENYAASFNFGLTHPSQLIRLWAADFFGHPSTYNHFSDHYYHEYLNYLGSFTLAFVIPILFRRGTKFWSFVFISSLFLAVSHPISQLIFSLPVPILTFSSASRLYFLTTASSAVLLTISLSRLDSFSHRLRIILCICLLIITSAAWLGLVPSDKLIISLRNLVIPVGLLGSSAILLVSLRRLLLPLLFLLLAFDLGRYYTKYNPFVPAKYAYPSTPITDFLATQSGNFRVVQTPGMMPPNTWGAYGLDSSEGYDPLHLLSYNRFYHLSEGKSYYARPGRYLQLEDFREKFLNALGVTYFLTASDSSPTTINARITKNYPLVFRDFHSYVYKNPAARDRAYFVDRVISFSDEPSLISALSDMNYDPATTAAILSVQNYPASSIGLVKQIAYQNNNIDINVSTTQDNFLVLADTYAPGWTVSIDNVPAEILNANLAFKSVAVPAGDHLVRFSYIPPGWYPGLALAGLSLLLSLSLPFLSRKVY